MNLRKFQDCINESENGKRHVLLGNGFSRSCRESIFSYDSLFEATNWSGVSDRLKSTFEAIDTKDFENVMEALEVCADFIELYNVPKSTKKELKSDAKKLRQILVDTLAKHHPEDPSKIEDKEYASCQLFLSNFERIYTVNYDLLLYWTLMKGNRRHDDGFRDPFEGESKDYYQEDFVEWQNFENSQTIYYIHGALHIFLNDHSLQKYCWSRTGIKLKKQILESLEQRKYPLIVAAGKGSQKLGKIQRSNYLGHGYRSLRQIGGSLFIYGHSLATKDGHIIDQLSGNRKLKTIYIGIFGDPKGKANKELIQNAKNIQIRRKEMEKELEIYFFDSSTAKVWR